MQFLSQGVAGSHLFRLCFDALPVPSAVRLDAVARFLDVHPRTVAAWLAGRREPPRAACAALWHESAIGRAVVYEHSERGSVIHAQHAAALARECDALRATIDRLRLDLDDAKRAAHGGPVPMNDAVFDVRRA